MIIGLMSDTHGSTFAVTKGLQAFSRHEVKQVIHAGDLGCYPNLPDGPRVLNEIERQLVKYGMRMVFVDGNHEGHPFLRELPAYNGHREVRPNLWHAERGSCLFMGGRWFQFVGGAWSINSPIDGYVGKLRGLQPMAEGVMWFPEEQLTDEEVAHAKAMGEMVNPDIMVSHDCPAGIDCVPQSAPGGGRFLVEGEPNRRRLSEIVDHVRPKLLIHGHYHNRYTFQVEDGPRIEGLGNDGLSGCFVLLDTETLEVAEVGWVR